MKEKDEEITEDDLDEAMKFLLSLPAPASEERKRSMPSKEDLDRKFRFTKDDDGFELQEIEDE